MKQFFKGPLQNHSRNIMRHLGYAEQRTRNGQISYTKRASSDRFPRYHAYVEDRDQGMQINLHVDQKEASYSGTSAHAGEYEGPLVEREMHRFRQAFEQMKSRGTTPKPEQQEEKKGFWSTLFG